MKSNGTNPGTEVDVKTEIGGDEATTTQDIDYSAGGVTTITSPFGSGTQATLTMPTATVDGTFSLDLSAIPNLKIKMATVDTGLFVRNPIAGTYTFDADGTTEDVTITWPTADCAIATFNAGWWGFKYGPVDEIPDGQLADKYVAFGTGAGQEVAGDFDNDDTADIGFYQNDGWWAFIDGPVDGLDDFQPADDWLCFGVGDGQAVVGDFNDDGIDDIGFYQNDGWWAFIYGKVVDGVDGLDDYQPADKWLRFGVGDGQAVVGDFNDDDIDDIGFYQNDGWWAFIYGKVVDGVDGLDDYQPASQWLRFGTGAGTPVVCDYNNDGIDDIGFYQNDGWWALEYGPVKDIADFQPADKWLKYGNGGEAPVAGDFNP